MAATAWQLYNTAKRYIGNGTIELGAGNFKMALFTSASNASTFTLSTFGSLTNQIGGLANLIQTNGQGTVGGIDSGTWSFWQNAVQSAAAPLQGGVGITPSATTIESLMLPLWLNQVRGDDKPDLIVSSNDYFTFYEQSQVSIKRYTDSDTASGGFVSLKYKNADVIFDGGSGIPAAHMYFLNTDYIEMVVHRDADLSVQEDMKPYNQDATVIPVLWMGNMVCSNRRLQGVLKA